MHTCRAGRQGRAAAAPWAPSPRRVAYLSIATELGGAGTVSPAALDVARRGLRGLLAHVGVLDGSPGLAAPTRIVSVGDPAGWVYAPVPGVFEPLALPGEDVAAGQPAARLHTPETPWLPPATVHFARSGLVLCRRQPSRAERGDCLFGTGREWAESVPGSMGGGVHSNRPQ